MSELLRFTMLRIDDGDAANVLVVPAGMSEQQRGSSIDWARADVVVDSNGVVLKNKYGPTGWTDWKS